MDKLLSENQQLRQMAERYAKEVQQLKNFEEQYRKEIEQLLASNDKLLAIIEKQLDGDNVKDSVVLSLQAISQRTEVESEMFQSQLPRTITGQNERLPQKNSLTLRPDPPHERLSRPEPMAIIEREEQLSIDVEGEKEKESEGDKNEIQALIKQFRRKIKTSTGERSFQQMHQESMMDLSKLSAIREDMREKTQGLISRANMLKNEITEIGSKDLFLNMLGSMNISEGTRSLLTTYIHQS